MPRFSDGNIRAISFYQEIGVRPVMEDEGVIITFCRNGFEDINEVFDEAFLILFRFIMSKISKRMGEKSEKRPDYWQRRWEYM